MIFSIAAYAHEPMQNSCAGRTCGTAVECDSINIPVFIVDGVEVRDIQGIPSEDIVNIEIIKDPAITKIFSPRLGGIMRITTKSKIFLKPILDEYNKRTGEQRQQRIPRELRIR